MEVRREDQEKINRFSSLHQKETILEDELRAKIVSTIPSYRFLYIHLPWCCIPTTMQLLFRLQWSGKSQKSNFYTVGAATLKYIRKRRKI